ncbi:MAG: hypothetical protein Q9191_002269 [Dirinaria sp. TL-2023a]
MAPRNPKPRRTRKAPRTDSDGLSSSTDEKIYRLKEKVERFCLGPTDASPRSRKESVSLSAAPDLAMFPSFDHNNNNNGHYPAPNSRSAPSPMANSQQQQSQIGNGGVNGVGGGMNGAGMGGGGGLLPMNAGAQMDVNLLYQKVLELSELLRENRERTQGIVRGAEELAVQISIRPPPNHSSSCLSEPLADLNEITAARIADLEHALATTRTSLATSQRENRENTRLLGDYEIAIGNITTMVRDYSFQNKSQQTNISLQYNKLLQEEKDAHLEARLEKDHWHKMFLRSVEMLREAYRLRCEEEETPVKVVEGLQEEVRGLRAALGMQRQLREEEAGWEILRDYPDRGDE